MPIETFYQLEIFDKNNNLISDSGEVPCNSFVLQFLQLVELVVRWTDNISIKDTGNTARNIDHRQGSKVHLFANAPLITDTYGIMIGTGTGAESNTDYALGTKIAHGTGSGQMEYEGTSFAAAHEDGGNVDMDIWRTFHNDSGASITVKEIGLVARAYDNDGSTYYNFLIMRDLVDQAVANNQTLSVKFIFRTTV